MANRTVNQFATLMHTFSNKNAFKKKLLKHIADIRTPHEHDYTLWEKKNYWLRLSGVKVGMSGVAIDRGFDCLHGLEENITIGDYAAIGIGAKFWCFNKIEVGKFCMFAADVTLTNGGHDRNSFSPFSGSLIIGAGCWFGNGARIIGPLTIGNNVIVAAGAVVVSDVPDGAIVAGVPAKPIGTRDLPNQVWHLGNTYFSPVTFELVDEHGQS